MEPTLSCPMAKLHKQTMSRQNGVNDLQSWVAQQVEKYEALLVTSSSGELEVNPVFFTPPSKTKQRPTITPPLHTSTSIQGSDTSAGLSSPHTSKALQQCREPEFRTTQDLGYRGNSAPHAASAIPTLFRKPIDWDEEAYLLEEQDVASIPALPELAHYATSCSDLDHQQPRTPVDISGEPPNVIEEASSKQTQEIDPNGTSGIEHGSTDSHDTLAIDGDQETQPVATAPLAQHTQPHPTQLSLPEPESTTTVSQPSLLPAKRQLSSISSSSGPAKKARPTTDIFIQNMTSQPSAQIQAASEMLKQVVDKNTPRQEQEK